MAGRAAKRNVKQDHTVCGVLLEGKDFMGRRKDPNGSYELVHPAGAVSKPIQNKISWRLGTGVTHNIHKDLAFQVCKEPEAVTVESTGYILPK